MSRELKIRVKPGSARTKVGGSYGEGELIVAVQAPAVDGRATEAALRAVAKALGLRRQQVELIRGATSRTKTLTVPDDCGDRVAGLLNS